MVVSFTGGAGIRGRSRGLDGVGTPRPKCTITALFRAEIIADHFKRRNYVLFVNRKLSTTVMMHIPFEMFQCIISILQPVKHIMVV